MQNQINQTIGSNIRKRRIAREMSLKRMGRLLGVSYQQLQKYEKGTNRLSAESLVKLSRYFGCSTDELCGLLPIPADPELIYICERLSNIRPKRLSRQINLLVNNIVAIYAENLDENE